MFEQLWRCRHCGWEGYEHETIPECLFVGNDEQPPDYEGRCPDCPRGKLSDMIQAELCHSCENEWAVKDELYCPGCMTDYAESVMEDR